MLQELLRRGKLQRKKLEAVLGLLMWATTTCPRVRPYLAPLYRDLRSAVGTLKADSPAFLHAVSDRITDELIAVYGLLDSFLKSESDSKKTCPFAACRARFAISRNRT